MIPASSSAQLVSIIVVNWNGEGLLKDCLESLSRQSHISREIILVDNGSTDGSVSFVRESFPEVRIVELAENKGFTGGNLEGFRVSQGEYIALLNNDTRADERWIENLLRPMLEDPSIGICASKLLIDGTRAVNSAGAGLTTAGVGFDRELGPDGVLLNGVESVFGASGAAVLYRRKMLEEIGFLDEDFFLYDEDTDLSFRAQLAGWKCVCVASAIVYHKMNATVGRLSDVHVYYHSRNLEFVWVKNMPPALMLRFAHHKVIQEFGAFCYVCVRHGKWRAFLRAKRDALMMLPKMLKKRRAIQRRRKVSNKYIKGMLTSIFNKGWFVQKTLQFIRG
jgi:GT2 family glycosyltransferase